MSYPSKIGAAPPPPPPAVMKSSTSLASKRPIVAPTCTTGAFMVELLIYNGSPFKDHWGYWVRSHDNPDVGVMIHATGDVRNGFAFEIKRNHDLTTTPNRPTTRFPLQWVDANHFNEKAMLNNGQPKIDNTPVCRFEASAFKVEVPGKTLNTVSDSVSITLASPTTSLLRDTHLAHVCLKDIYFQAPSEMYPPPISAGTCWLMCTSKVKPGKRITQRNCQTWIVESADQLVKDNIFTQEVAEYLHAIEQ